MFGLMFTSVTGAKFWHPCTDGKKGFAEMQSVSWQYGPGWGQAGSKLEYGRCDGDQFQPTETIKTGWGNVDDTQEYVPAAV